MIKTPIRLGIIGTGLATDMLHWPALAKLPNLFQITWVCNRTASKAEAFADKVAKEGKSPRPRVTTNPDEVYAATDVDAVSLVLPQELNLEQTQKAAKADKGVMVEKPLAENLESAKALVTLVGKYPNLTFMVAENWRYRKIYQKVQDILTQGQIGNPYYVEYRAWQHMTPETSPFARTPWRIDHSYEGGFVTDGGVHSIAVLRDLFGDLTPAGGFTRAINPAIGRTDMLTTFFTASDRGTKAAAGTPAVGAGTAAPTIHGLYSLGYTTHAAYRDEMNIFGTLGSLKIAGNSGLRSWVEAGQFKSETFEFADDGGYKAEYEDFARALVEGARVTATVQESYEDLRTMLAFLGEARVLG